MVKLILLAIALASFQHGVVGQGDAASSPGPSGDVLAPSSTCPPGSIIPDSGPFSGKCTACLRNTYQAAVGATTCDRCPNGTVSYLGATACTICRPGRIILSNSASVGLGDFLYSYYGLASYQGDCVDCAYGTYSNTTGATQCTLCPSGYYTPGVGADRCEVCPAGRYVDPADRACKPCPAGTYNLNEGQSGVSNCIRCPFGYTSAPGSTQCELCPPGNYVHSVAVSRPYGTCTPCDIGSYNDEYSFSGAACKPCPPGFTSAAGSSSCTACPPGTFLDLRDFTYSRLTCVKCDTNTFNPEAAFASTTGCPPCPKGSTSPSGSAKCTVCPAGSFVDISGPPGTYNYMTCHTCPPNTFNPAPGLQSAACNPCPPGHVSEAGATACQRCPAGSYVAANGKCALCPRGTFSQLPAAVGFCTPCPPGFTSKEGSTEASHCVACPPGTYSVPHLATGELASSSVAGRCNPCPANSYSNATALVGADGCRGCPAGHTSEPGSRQCTVCPAGSFAPLVGQDGTRESARCSLCEQGFYSRSAASTACTPCPLGSSTAKRRGATACTACSGREVGAIVNGAPTCAACDEPLLAAGAYTCPVGSGREAGCYLNSPCVPCPAGTVAAASDDFLSDVCVACESGSVSSSPGSLRCESCPVGSATEGSDGAPVCTPCPRGYYGVLVPGSSTLPGAAATVGRCKPCPPDAFGPSEGATECAACPAGATHFVQGRTNASDCTVPYIIGGTLEMNESVSWLSVSVSSVGGGPVLSVRTVRDVSARHVSVVDGGGEAVAMPQTRTYDSETERTINTGSFSDTVQTRALSPPVRTGVVSYRLFHLAPPPGAGGGPDANAGGAAGDGQYALSVEWSDGVSTACRAVRGAGGGGSGGGEAGVGVGLRVVCQRVWKSETNSAPGGTFVSTSVTETLTLEELAA